MTKQNILLLAVSILLAACGEQELTKEKAGEIIASEKGYPRTIEYEIFTADPTHAEKLLHKGLESSGYVTVQKKQTLSEIGNPIVSFTEKAKDYLLPVSEKEVQMAVQRVRIAYEHLSEVTQIENSSETTARAFFSVTYEDISPFSVLLNSDFSKPMERTAEFVKVGDKWQLAKRR